jgi:hypothetical protein
LAGYGCFLIQKNIPGVPMTAISRSAWDKYGQAALWLALFTIVYNIVEGLVSLGFGIQDETLALSGFGIDSFIEVLSGAGILAMVLRLSLIHI